MRYKSHADYIVQQMRRLTAPARARRARQDADPWKPIIAAWLETHPGRVTLADALTGALDMKDPGQWTRADGIRVDGLLIRLGRVYARRPWRDGGLAIAFYYTPEELKQEKNGSL